MTLKNLPLHADTVGNYLRTDILKQARLDFTEGKMSREGFNSSRR